MSLEDAALAGDLLSDGTDFLTPEQKQKCESILTNPEKIVCAGVLLFSTWRGVATGNQSCDVTTQARNYDFLRAGDQFVI